MNPDPTLATDVAISLLRFSSPKQERGDTRRRQTALAEDWCARNAVPLDKRLWMFDPVASAYTGAHRKNPDRHALAAFLKMIEGGLVQRGWYLLIENLDRLSREDEVPACHLLTGILMAGVRVVQLSPYEMMLTEKSNGWELMRAVMELSRGHGESALKSERVGKAWRQKKKAAREHGRVMTRNLPAWVRERDGKLTLIPERAAVIQRVFDLTAAGYGLGTLVRLLTAEGVPFFGDSGTWHRSYLARILKDRRALGELQPRGKGGTPEGDPIRGYFPAVVTEAEWERCRAGAEQRRRRPGRIGREVNLFAGLIKDALGGSAYFVRARMDPNRKGPPQRELINVDAIESHGTCRSFPLPTFERAVLSCLREIDPHEILNGDRGPDETLVLGQQLAGIEAEIAEAAAYMDAKGFSATIGNRITALEARKRDLVVLLAQARQKAAHPLSETWGEARTLLETFDTAPDPQDARLRLRSALRRMVDVIQLLVVPRGRDRLAAVQIWFAGGKKHRDYIVFHRAARANRSARTEGGGRVKSLAAVGMPDDLDLRQKKQAAALAEVLAATGLVDLWSRMAP
jgi:DNA invertase Pin-like site-specific DNA recombinase